VAASLVDTSFALSLLAYPKLYGGLALLLFFGE
jgi:hypothetical protein